MGNMSIRNIPDEAHEALKARAKSNGRSAEAEVRAMIIETARQSNSGGFGSRLTKRFKGVEGDELNIERDRTPARPVSFE